jgi:DNA helicase HerA-like ATPase
MNEKQADIKPPSREIALVFGKTGMGKSNYIKTYLSALKRVIILDPLDEYPALEFQDINEMIDYLEGAEGMEEGNKSRKGFCVKSCNILHLEALGEIVDGMRDVTFIIEEAQRCLPASRQDLPDSLQRIIFLGRHFGRSLVVAAQRPSIVHIAARSQWTRIITFNLSEIGDVRWIEGTSGYDVQNEFDIRKLSVGTYFEITPGSFETKTAPLYIPRRVKGGKEDQSGLKNVFDLFPSASVSNL